MSDKKHIDRLFQEKFKDFEAKPNANVWEGIQNRLDKPEQKKKPATFPLWAKFSSIAAVLLLFISIGMVFSGKEEKQIPSVVDITKDNNSIPNDNSLKKEQDLNKAIISENNKSYKNIDNTVIVNNTDANSSIQTEDTNSKKYLEEKFTHKTSKEKTSTIKTTLFSQKKTNNTVVNINKSTTQNKKTSTDISNTNLWNSNNKQANTTALAKSNKTNQYLNNNKTKENIQVRSIDNLTSISLTTSKNAQFPKQITVDSIQKKKNAIIPIDYTKSNAIEEAIAKNKLLNENNETSINRWSLNTNIAPVYYNTLGKGSHIDDQFINNPKNGELNTSYGIQVGYALNSKLKVRSGINKLNLSYDTANVIVYQDVSTTPGTNPLRNINFTNNTSNGTIGFLSSNNLSTQQSNGNLAIHQLSNVINDNLNTALSQRISYIEVPLELEYNLVNKSSGFGLNIIGGLSTFILNGNEIVSEIENRKTHIGEANNINNISFSSNFALGLNYKFNKALKFNLEPTFKYQINAFNNTAGNFKPYIIGLYTGFSYKF